MDLGEIPYNERMPHLPTTEGFIEIPHRADVAIKIWSTDLNGLFIQAARGLYGLMGVEKENPRNISRTISLAEDDLETLLIRFLNELILDVQLQSVMYEAIDIEIQQMRIGGELKGKKITSPIREIKAATYHECNIVQTATGYETMLVFDI